MIQLNEMPKLTVYFKDKEIESFSFSEGKVRIGRDETNEVMIDSLAIAPVHAVITLRGSVATIKPLQDEFPITVNGEKIKEGILNNSDMIALGKHHILFNSSDSVGVFKPFAETTENEPLPTAPFFGEPELPNGNFQIMDGENIGKIIPIKKTMVQLGRPGHGIVVVTRKKEGYFVSTLENKGSLTINGEPIENKIVKLSDNDILGINEKSLQFFLS
jgi:pSer/pThr/pTyr-binding forkhead associated (FHA) protein